MKKIYVLVMFSFLTVSLIKASSKSDIEGSWYTKEKRSIVQIQPKQSTSFFEGEILWVSKEARKDAIGKKILQNIEYQQEGNYTADLYIPKYNKYKECKILVEGNQLTITLTFGIGTKEIIWEKKK